MVWLYECDACRRGDHKHCEIGYPMREGDVCGGSICRCGCKGNPHWNDPTEIKKGFKIDLKKIKKFEQRSRKANLRVKKEP